MGWFDDNHPMGQAAEDAAHEAFEAFAGKWQRDPPKALSSRVPPKRLERPGAEWDATKWRKSSYKEYDVCNKTRAKTFWLLTDGDLAPLEWRRGMNNAGYNTLKEYRTKEVEATSWAKHGGPEGLKAAKAEAKAAKNPSISVPQA